MKFVHAPLKGDQQRLHGELLQRTPNESNAVRYGTVVLREYVQAYLNFVLFVAVCEAIRLVT